MTRIFSDYAYGSGPRDGCWWDTTCDLPETSQLDTDIACNVAIIGAKFTKLNAALRLAEQGVDVVVLDARHIGWGASGRNGGFCCLGGGSASDAQLDRRFGQAMSGLYRVCVSRISAMTWSALIKTPPKSRCSKLVKCQSTNPASIR